MSAFKKGFLSTKQKTQQWQQYLVDSLLATIGSLLVTAIIAVFHLYPRIPNISIVYLVIVLTLASTRGRYAAIFASLVAFFAFDFFVVPPLYTFVMYHAEEWIALFMFLLDAILTSHLASALRQQAIQAAQREKETRTLYDFVKDATGVEDVEHRLQSIAQAIVNAFAAWGVHDCTILQQDTSGTLHVTASAYQTAKHIPLSNDEQTVAAWIMQHERSIGQYTATTLPYTQQVQQAFLRMQNTTCKTHQSLYLLPLRIGQKIVGVLRLIVIDGSPQLQLEEQFATKHQSTNASMTFFWAFLHQAATLIEHVRLQRENVSMEILQHTDTLRAALLSSVSHDLRTPLTVIKASASALQQEDITWDEETRHSFAHSIEREADRLNRLVGNLLDMSRIEDGALKPEKDLYSIRALLQDVLDRLHPMLRGRDVCLSLADDLPPLSLDYLQIDQVFTNLLENAVRYTPSGSPIEVSAQHGANEIIISVADRGPGIATTELEHIFDKFYRVLQSRDEAAGGTVSGSGLGLAVCKGLVEAHNGKIWAEQRPDGGAIFYVALPMNNEQEEAL